LPDFKNTFIPESRCYLGYTSEEATAVSIGRLLPLVEVESNTTVQYQSYNIFLGFQFLVYEKVERIFLIISDYS
jgi:hypothetical protein